MKILLIQLKRIGDLVLTTPAIAALREKFPRADISLIVSSGTRELLSAIRGVDHTFIARGRIADAADWFTLARRKYDYSIDFTRNDRSAFLTLLSRAKKRVTSDFARVQSRVRSLSYNELVKCPIRFLHTVDYHLALLEPLGIRGAAQKLQLHLPAWCREEAARVLKRENVRGDFLLLHPGSARLEKFWEPERWSALMDFAAEQQMPCVMTGGNSALEKTHLAEIRRRSRSPVVDLSGKLDLLTLAALIERARLLTTVDSAPMHLAAATQTPQVVLFGPTNPLHWRPRFSPAIILQAGEAAPLSEFSAKQKPVAMNRISTEQVIDAMKALLLAPSGVSA
ncbi:MAG: putative lipopolysaccharide heptosyltransferase III [Chthoniobacterales bacterium]